MGKPEDIPQDVWDAASELLYAVEAMPSDGNISIIARAILAAKAEEVEDIQNLIAERMSGEINLILIAQDADDAESHLLHSLLLREQQEIADAIRKRGEENVSTARKSQNQEA